MCAEPCVPHIHAGEEPGTGIVSGVTQSESTTIVSCVEDERLEFQVLCSGFRASRSQEPAQALHTGLCGSSVWHRNEACCCTASFHRRSARLMPVTAALRVARSHCCRVSVTQPCSWVRTMRRHSRASRRGLLAKPPYGSDPEHVPACTLQDGQLVTFTEVEGIPQLNDGKPRRVRNVKVAPLSHAHLK